MGLSPQVIPIYIPGGKAPPVLTPTLLTPTLLPPTLQWVGSSGGSDWFGDWIRTSALLKIISRHSQ